MSLIREAAAQFVGFKHATSGGINPLISLVETMGLKKHEWEVLKTGKYCTMLSDSDKEEIDKHFVSEEIKTKLSKRVKVVGEYLKNRTPENLKKMKRI